MDNYRLEAEINTLKGTIICGSREGYSGNIEHSLEEVLSIIDEINVGRVQRRLPISNIMINEVMLIGRSGDAKYHEKVYKIELSWSPRAEPIKVDTFREVLHQYADELGVRLKQERVYLDFDGMTYAYKRIT